MPRIYAPNEAHNMAWGEVDFTEGVAVCAASAASAIAYFTAEGYTIDSSKHIRTLLDDLTPTQLRALCTYLGMTIDQGEDPDTKYALVRAIEGDISTQYIATVTVSSGAGSASGKTAITITGAGTYKYKTAVTTAPALLYMDVPDSTWATIATGAEFTPTATHDKIAVVKLNAAGYVIGIGSDGIAVNEG